MSGQPQSCVSSVGALESSCQAETLSIFYPFIVINLDHTFQGVGGVMAPGLAPSAESACLPHPCRTEHVRIVPMPKVRELKPNVATRLDTPSDIAPDAARAIAGALNALLADTFALYLKTKNFHWHLSGPHFRDYHLMLDEQAEQIFATTDEIAERVRKIGGTTLRSIGHVARLLRVLDNDADYVGPLDMLAELRDDNKAFAARMLEAMSCAESI